jgi:hypothetical protein
LRSLFFQQREQLRECAGRGVAVAAPLPRQASLVVALVVDSDDAAERVGEAIEDGAIAVDDADLQ